MSMEEKRTKLICNLGTCDFFIHPLAGGIWRKMDKKIKLKDGTYYECRKLEGNDVSHILGSERVELADIENQITMDEMVKAGEGA